MLVKYLMQCLTCSDAPKRGEKTIGVFFILILVTRIILAILQLGVGLFMGINLGKKKCQN